MRILFWRKKETAEDVKLRYATDHASRKRARAEFEELQECVTELRRLDKILCPYNRLSYGIEHHNNELHVAIEDRIVKIVNLQSEILI